MLLRVGVAGCGRNLTPAMTNLRTAAVWRLAVHGVELVDCSLNLMRIGDNRLARRQDLLTERVEIGDSSLQVVAGSNRSTEAVEDLGELAGNQRLGAANTGAGATFTCGRPGRKT